MIIPGHKLPGGIVFPFRERTIHHGTGMSGGRSLAGYDVHLDQDLWLWPGKYRLGSTVERFAMPLDVLGKVHDKSTLVRQGVFVHNTVIEPGWCGWLTLEISSSRWTPFRLERGQPIAQVVFHRLEEPVPYGYDGKYQNQDRGPVPARREEG